MPSDQGTDLGLIWGVHSPQKNPPILMLGWGGRSPESRRANRVPGGSRAVSASRPRRRPLLGGQRRAAREGDGSTGVCPPQACCSALYDLGKGRSGGLPSAFIKKTPQARPGWELGTACIQGRASGQENQVPGSAQWPLPGCPAGSVGLGAGLPPPMSAPVCKGHVQADLFCDCVQAGRKSSQDRVPAAAGGTRGEDAHCAFQTGTSQTGSGPHLLAKAAASEGSRAATLPTHQGGPTSPCVSRWFSDLHTTRGEHTSTGNSFRLREPPSFP